MSASRVQAAPVTVEALVADMERWLDDPLEDLDPVRLAAWNEALQRAAASEPRGPEWPATLARAQAVAAKIPICVSRLQAKQAEVVKELSQLGQGKRALKGYGAAAR